MANVKLTIYVFLLVNFISVCIACNGYTLKINEIKNCVDNSIVTLSDDFRVDMDKDCNLIPHGCAEVKAFATAIGTYKASKPPLPPLAGEIDMCQAIEQYGDKVDVFMDMLGLPKRCPVVASKLCMDGSKKVNIAKYKSKMGMAVGKIDVLLNVAHDTGKTCVHVNIEIMKAKKG